MIGSYFPDAIAATGALANAGHACRCCFYDIDTPITLAASAHPGGHGVPRRSPHSALRRLSEFYRRARASPNWKAAFTRSARSLSTARSILTFTSPSLSAQDYRCDLSYLGTYAADRQPKLVRLLGQPAALLPQHRFLVAGAMYPPQTEWPGNVERINHIAPPDHPGFYSSARFSLNLTRDDMVAAGYSPSVRLFEASACGAAILSDDWQGLDDFFTPGQEILIPRDEHDVADILLHLTDEQRLRIGRGARERTLAHHTAAQRAVEFEKIVSSLATPHPPAGS